MKKIYSFALAAFFSFAAVGAAHAAMGDTTVTGLTGTLTVTTKNPTTGAMETKTYNPGDTVPPIPKGAKIAVEGGKADLNAAGLAFELPSGAAIVSKGDNDKANLQVVTGSVQVLGKTVKAGQQIGGVTTNSAYGSYTAGTVFTTASFMKISVVNNPNQDFGVSCQAGVSPSAPC